MDFVNFFDELYKSTYKKVLNYIISKCGNTEDIKDIFQETYMEVARVIRKRGVDYILNPEKFVLKIAKRKIYRHYKLQDYFKKVNQYNIDKVEVVEPITLEEIVITNDMIEQIKKFVESKNELTKKIFYLHYGMEMSIKDIALELSLSESNVKNHLYRTLREIKENFME